MLPLYLYKGLCTPGSAICENANSGLLYDKFCDTWPKFFSEQEKKKKGNYKREWLKRASNQATKNELLKNELLKEYAERLRALAGGLGRHEVLTTISGLAIGVGNANPTEVGLRWHPTLGVPYIPGSSLKGIVRAWARDSISWDNESEKESQICRIFGGEGGVGSVIFLDAIPEKNPSIAMDVLTPHYKAYYESYSSKPSNKSVKRKPPGDWMAPVPVFFLTVKKGCKFIFAVCPRTPEARGDCNLAMDWIKRALKENGAGAKTAVGYGRFDDSSSSSSTQNRLTQHESTDLASLEGQIRDVTRTDKLSKKGMPLYSLREAGIDIEVSIFPQSGELFGSHPPDKCKVLLKKYHEDQRRFQAEPLKDAVEYSPQDRSPKKPPKKNKRR
ncbi:MAG: type III-B CRISPR module RAMP protein Cmr6 [Candidatus Baltobacteraceae bacterium]